MAVPYTFGSATTSIPLSQLDSNFATGITLGNTAIQLGNTVTTLNNMTLANVTISSGTSSIVPTSIANGTSNVTIAASGGNIAMATNGATAITIDTAQNVGVGTTPSSWGSGIPVIQTTSGYVYGSAGNSRNAYYNGSNWKYISAGSYATLYQGGDNHTWSVTTSTQGANNNITWNAALTLDSYGSLGVGVTPAAWNTAWRGFQVGNRTSLAQSTSDTLLTNNAIYDSGGWKYQLTQYASGITINANNGQVGIITAPSGTAGNAITFTNGPYVANLGTSWTNSSDERLKNITGEIANGLTKVCSLRAAEFTWKNDESNKPCVGLIAQDVQAVLPEVINSSKKYGSEDETEYLGVNYTETIPLLVAAIKELKAIVDAQATTIAALQAKVGA